MHIYVEIKEQLGQVACDSLLVGLYQNMKVSGSYLEEIDKALAGYVTELLSRQPKCGEFGEIHSLYTCGKLAAKHIIFIGLGNKEKLTAGKIRQAAGTAIRAAQKANARRVLAVLYRGEETLPDAVQAMVEGSLLGLYSFDYYKTEKKAKAEVCVTELGLLAESQTDIAKLSLAVEKAQIIAESISLARDLVNHPGQVMTPTKMAWHASQIAKEGRMELTVLDKGAMEKQGMHALLAVAQGSVQPPAFIILKYTGNKKSSSYVSFVGKGITFDSGGISLKPSENMGDMKGDMAGGAAVLAAMYAIGRLGLPVNILALVPCTENMPSGSAVKPGDVISSLGGKTIEVVNTDAEGRLILADAVAYAVKQKVEKIIDLATLTGACVVALGNVASGLITNQPEWCNQVKAAAAAAGEKVWEMPHFEEYEEQIKSDIADLKNSGGRMAGMITAGLFIGHFVEAIPWVHMDIAGTSDTTKAKGDQAKGGTGVGVRTLVELAYSLAEA